MSELLKCVENDGDLDAIDGLAYRKGTDVVKTKLRKRIEKLDILPIPKHEYYSRYIRKYRKAHIVSSRGCPAKCKFCSPMGYWGGFRARSAQSIFEEIQYLVKRFGRLDFFHFQDQCFTYDRQRVVDLCNILAVNDVKINWGFETRVDCVDPELLQLLKGAGCSYIAYGIESGSDRILNTLNKNFTSAQAADALKWTHDAGIRTCVYLIVGSPGETKKTIAETKQFLRRHAKYIPEIQIGRYFIYPWSPLYRKLFKDDKDFWYKNKKIPVNLNRGSFLGLILDQVEIRLSYILSKGPRFALNRLLLIFKRKKLSFF